MSRLFDASPADRLSLPPAAQPSPRQNRSKVLPQGPISTSKQAAARISAAFIGAAWHQRHRTGELPNSPARAGAVKRRERRQVYKVGGRPRPTRRFLWSRARHPDSHLRSRPSTIGRGSAADPPGSAAGGNPPAPTAASCRFPRVAPDRASRSSRSVRPGCRSCTSSPAPVSTWSSASTTCSPGAYGPTRFTPRPCRIWEPGRRAPPGWMRSTGTAGSSGRTGERGWTRPGSSFRRSAIGLFPTWRRPRRILIGLPERNLLIAAGWPTANDEFASMFADYVADRARAADEPIDRSRLRAGGRRARPARGRPLPIGKVDDPPLQCHDLSSVLGIAITALLRWRPAGARRGRPRQRHPAAPRGLPVGTGPGLRPAPRLRRPPPARWAHRARRNPSGSAPASGASGTDIGLPHRRGQAWRICCPRRSAE